MEKGSAMRAPWDVPESEQDPRAAAAHMLSFAPGIASAERYNYMSMASRLSESDARQLLNLLRTAAGAGLGALLARFFLGKGMGRAVAGALIGGAIARLTSRSSQSNNTDIYGRPYVF